MPSPTVSTSAQSSPAQSSPAGPSLSVVVPATDAPPTLGRCVAAIRAADDTPDELIVVEDRGLSASAARNAGAARATGDVVVFVDADVEVHADALGRMRDAFAADAGLTALFGSYDDAPDHPGMVSAFRNLLHHHVHQHGGGPAETFWTGLGAVRRRALLAAGGFDEARYPVPSIEDIELGDRLRAGGASLRLDPTIQGTHLKRWTLRSMLWTDLRHRGMPWIMLQLRTRRVARSLNCGWCHRASALACVLLVMAAALGAPLLGTMSLAALVGINRGFYALLVRRLGPARAVAGVALHSLHHLVAVVAVVAGVTVTAASWLRAQVTAGTAPVVDPAAAE